MNRDFISCRLLLYVVSCRRGACYSYCVEYYSSVFAFHGTKSRAVSFLVFFHRFLCHFLVSFFVVFSFIVFPRVFFFCIVFRVSFL